MVINITFDQNWLFSDSGIHAGVVEMLISRCRKTFSDQEFRVKNRGMSQCALELNTSRSRQETVGIVEDILRQIMKTDDITRNCTLHVEGDTGAPVRPGSETEKKPGSGSGGIEDLIAAALREQGGSDKKPEEPKPEEKRPEEKKPESGSGGIEELIAAALREQGGSDKKPEEPKPEEKKPEEKKPESGSGGIEDLVAAALREMSGGTDKKPEEKRPAEDGPAPERETPPTADPEPGAAPVPDPEPEHEPEPEPREKTALEQAEELVSAHAFKALCREIAARADAIKANKTQRIFFSETYLFSVDTGSGFHTALQLLDTLLTEKGLFEVSAGVSEFRLPSPQDDDARQKMNNAVSSMENALNSQRILSIDISNWVGHTGKMDFKKMLMFLFQKNRKCLIVFRAPYVRPSLLEEIRGDIADVINVRPVVFEPFTGAELRQIAERFLSGFGITMETEAWEEFDRTIEREQQDGFFYGIHTVEKIAGEMVRKMEVSGAARVITRDVLSTGELPVETEEEELTMDDLVGMEPVANRLQEVLNQILFARSHHMGGDKPCMHMCFTGNPGTGKTTVARILGRELKQARILRSGKFFEHKGRDLCGKYVGHTAPITTAICQEAYGSVLFIDEAYSLASSGSDVDYGREAIDTLIAEMENHYDDLVVIFAGYPDEMQKLLDSNPGLRSRVPYMLEFPNYTREQLLQIFMKMSGRHFEHAPGFEERAKEYFDSLPQQLLDSRAFGNARFVRNLYERVWSKALSRSGSAGGNSIQLTAADLDAAAAEFSTDLPKTGVGKIGFQFD